jgi:uncharacterized membrane protein YozB (DUF420 family)/cytochrome oxidase Cu insertion factor (SCO1/SenC/PrrC family)
MARHYFLALALVAVLGRGAAAGAEEDDFGPVGEFSLTERSGRTVTREDLRGKVWIASFVFTRCTQGCPQVSATMHDLQQTFAGTPNVLLVTFTVDPEHDNPAELRQYADHFEADPQRWLFLTGSEKDLRHLIRDSFHLTAEPTREADRRPGNEVTHDTKLVVVDAQGHIRGYFEGLRDSRSADPEQDYQANLQRLRTLVKRLSSGSAINFPKLNATLNAVSGVLLIAGYLFIRRRRVSAHASCMLSALMVSTSFLASYLYYHIVVKGGKSTHFADQVPGAPLWVGCVYYGILGTHILLAAFTVPLALYTAWQGLRGRLQRHIRVARWTLPIWLYVSITGVVVYWMLYQF